MQVIFQNTVNTSVFEEVVSKTLYNTAFCRCGVVKVTQIAVFWLRFGFFDVAQHIANTDVSALFWGCERRKNIVNSVVLSLVGAENTVTYDVLSAFRNRSFRT